MNGEPVTVRTYASEIEAELGRLALEAEGIPSFVATNDAAGMLRFVQGVQLVVRQDQAERALQVLGSTDDDE